MNIKVYLALIGVSILLIAAACTSSRVSSSALDPAQPATRNDKAVVVPVTGAQPSSVVGDFQSYPSQQLHRYCAMEDNQKQAKCLEKVPSGSMGLILFSSNNNADVQTYPSQQVHSKCVSENSERQKGCIP